MDARSKVDWKIKLMINFPPRTGRRGRGCMSREEVYEYEYE
jgi:hypothetical protein